jgi:hypothetical protein
MARARLNAMAQELKHWQNKTSGFTGAGLGRCH